MKLRQKLAMILAATSLATTVPVTTQAIQYDVTREPLTTQSKDNYNKYWHVKLEDYQAANSALNLIIHNNNNDYLPGPIAFEIIATDIRFDDSLYTETIHNEPFHGDDMDVTHFETTDGTPVGYRTAYALEDKSNSHDGNTSFVGYPNSNSPSELPHRLFVIDEDGNYTSYVSSSYAAKKRYIYDGATTTSYLTNSAEDAGEEIYLFAEAKEPVYSRSIFHKPLESVYVNVIPDGNKNLVVNDSDIIKSTSIDEAGITPGTADGKTFTNVYTFDDPNLNQNNAQVYLKEFTIYLEDRDQLYVEFYQNFNTGLDSRLYIPLAFSVTGEAPSIRLDGNDINYSKITLSTSSTANQDLLDVSLKRLGQIATDGHGNIGTFEIEEQQEYVFYGQVTANGSSKWEEDFENSLEHGDTGVTFLLQLNDKTLEFDLNEGDRYWDELSYDSDGFASTDPGALQDYIAFSGGLRNQEEYIQVEVLAVEGNEMLLRLIDTTQEYKPRNYEGVVQIRNLPVTVASRHDTLDTGTLELKVTQVEDLSYESKGGDLGLFDFDDANEIEEEFDIARIIDEQVSIRVDDELELVSGQESDKLTFTIEELLPGAIDTRDEFFFKFNNCDIVDGWLDDMEFEFNHDYLPNNSDSHNGIFYKDDSEYVLDFDAMYDACIADGLIDGDSNSEKEEAWQELIETVEFEIELFGKAGAEGDISVAIESDNLREEEILLYLGTTHPAFIYQVEPVYIDLGVRGQKGGRIVITETAEEMFQDGREVLIAIEDLGLENNTFDEVDVYTDPDSGLDVKDSFKDGVLIIEIDDESDDGPGSIIIEDISFDIWAGTPRGGYDLYIGGNALSADNEVYDDLEPDGNGEDAYFTFIKQSDIRVQDFVTIGEGSAPVASSQVIMDLRNGVTYKDGSQVSITSRPYQTPEGWVMVSAVDLALLYNIPMDKITASTDDEGKMTVTIIKGIIGQSGSTVTTLKEGSNIVWVNATPVIMGTPVVLGADNKAYIHFLPMSQALGLSAQWDNYSQRLTFSN